MELLDANLGGTIPLDIIVAAPDQSAPLPGLDAPVGEAPPVAADDEFLADAGFEDDPFAASGDDFASDGSVNEFADDSFADDAFGDDPFATSDAFADDPFGDDPFGSDATSQAPGFWFSLEGMRLIDRLHARVEAFDETGKVQSLSATFELFRQLLGDDIGGVELALAQNALPGDIGGLLVDPLLQP